MNKENLLEFIMIAAALLALLGAAAIFGAGCKSLKQYEYYETGKLKTALYSDEFNPGWSDNKESILKTGNIGITL